MKSKRDLIYRKLIKPNSTSLDLIELSIILMYKKPMNKLI